MTLQRRVGHRRILEELTREAKLAKPLLAQIREEFEGHDWLDPGAIGRFYEQALSENTSSRKATGSFYTPDYIVDYLVEQTLGAWIRPLSLSQICTLRILDPSCGGGAFLLGVLRFLEKHCVKSGEVAGPKLRERLSAVLVGVDLDPSAVEVSLAAIRFAIGGKEQRQVRSSLIVGDALLTETKIGQVDAIVGNPPWGQKSMKIPAHTKALYKKRYTTAKGAWDPFKFFVERSLKLIPQGGRWGLVLPEVLLLKNYQVVRDFILEHSEIDDIAQCGRAFEGVNMEAVTICGTRKNMDSSARHSIRVVSSFTPDWSEKTLAHHHQEQSVFWEMSGHRFNLYLHGKPLALYRRLQTFPRFGQSFEMHEGVHSGNCRAKLFPKEKVGPHCYPLIMGRGELCRFSLTWAGRFVNTDPTCIDKVQGEYANVGQAHWHGPNKIVVRRTGDKVIAAFDAKGFYVSNNMFVVSSKSPKPIQFYRAVTALLNSEFMTWYFRSSSPRKGKMFAELKLEHLREFPMPKPPAWGKIEAALAQLEKDLRLCTTVDSKKLWNQLNSLVESAYEISPQERELIKLSQ